MDYFRNSYVYITCFMLVLHYMFQLHIFQYLFWNDKCIPNNYHFQTSYCTNNNDILKSNSLYVSLIKLFSSSEKLYSYICL